MTEKQVTAATKEKVQTTTNDYDKLLGFIIRLSQGFQYDCGVKEAAARLLEELDNNELG